jgi:hypothetical protein
LNHPREKRGKNVTATAIAGAVMNSLVGVCDNDVEGDPNIALAALRHVSSIDLEASKYKREHGRRGGIHHCTLKQG